MSYENKTMNEILDDKTYPMHDLLIDLLGRIRKFSNTLVENVNDDSITFKIRDMDFVKIETEENYIKVSIDMPYARLVDLSHNCEVDPFNGRDGVDIVSFKIRKAIDIQYGVSIAQQSYTYVKRLKL